MSNRVQRVFICAILFLGSALIANSTPTYAYSTTTNQAHFVQQPAGSKTMPVVEPDYIYNQLYTMATSFQHRESGYDKQLPVKVNGHDEFANYWSQEIVRDLQGFGTTSYRDDFSVRGWRSRPTTAPGTNVEVTVPGSLHPEQIIVIGCHYDGMATSTQSANDDASGCAIELGIARALGNYWQQQHVAPQRTLRFVLFDTEEQGLYGSYHYVNATVNGDLNNIVAMFNEEQNGIAYPLRYLGQLQNALMPFYVELSPVSGPRSAQIKQFRDLMATAVPAVFQQIRQLGVQTLSYHDKNGHDVEQPVFTPDQLNNVKQEDDKIGSSDQVPFTEAGIPCATFVGNSTYYDYSAPRASYPFDQPTDTIQLMNTFASGNSIRSAALTLALALPAMLTTWMLQQPSMLGESASSGHPLITMGDIARLQTGNNVTFTAQAAQSLKAEDAPIYHWDFGDGQNASGTSVHHTYASDGTYTLTLTATTKTAVQRISKELTIGAHNPTYPNQYDRFYSTGIPPTNKIVKLPEPDGTLSDTVQLAPQALWTTALASGPMGKEKEQLQQATTAPLPSQKKRVYDT
ncbi:M28 family peptidase [Dictyobacter halimunensis]